MFKRWFYVPIHFHFIAHLDLKEKLKRNGRKNFNWATNGGKIKCVGIKILTRLANGIINDKSINLNAHAFAINFVLW